VKVLNLHSLGSSLPLILKRDISFEFSPDSPSVSSDPRKLSEPPPLDPFVHPEPLSRLMQNLGFGADSAGFSHVKTDSVN
jgi:hypothetical protein